MKRRIFLVVPGMIAFAFICFNHGCVKLKSDVQPNVVLFFVDDMGYGDLTCYGHPTIMTPNIDRMAQEGIRLTSFYAVSPVCSPSRAGLLTGRYPDRAGVPNGISINSDYGMPVEEITIADQLKKTGYKTACIGKWHLGHSQKEFLPSSRGFDYYWGLLVSNDYQKPWVQTDRQLKLYENLEPIEYPINQNTLTKRATEKAINFINESKNNPFFLYMPYSMVHLPVFASEQFAGKSLNGKYGDAVEEIDWSVGQIIETLNKNEIEKNTLVIFASDNGPWCNMPPRMQQAGNELWHAGSPGLLRGAKSTTYEGGMRVPGIVKWPGKIPAGRVSTDLAATIDLFTTILKACNADVPGDRKIDGYDIMPMLKGQSLTPRKELFYAHRNYLHAVRIGKYKFRCSNETLNEENSDTPVERELYDLEFDPSEKYNIAERYPERAAKMEKRLREFAVDLNCTVAK